MLDYVPIIMNEPLNVWVVWVVLVVMIGVVLGSFVLASSRSFYVNLLALSI